MLFVKLDLDVVWTIGMQINKPMLMAYVQILLGVSRHQVIAHGVHRGMLFEDIVSLFVQIRTCNS